MEADQVATELAIEELGEDAPIRRIVNRAQTIKEELLRTETVGAN